MRVFDAVAQLAPSAGWRPGGREPALSTLKLAGNPLKMSAFDDPKTRPVPVMMLTGERGADTVLQAMDAGADDYMVKPFHPDLLLERVSRLVSRAEKAAAVWEL